MQIRFLSFLLLLMTPWMTWGQASRSVVQAFNSGQAKKVILDLPGVIDILLSPGELVQIETEVHIENANDAILKALIHALRYDLKVVDAEDGFTIRPSNQLIPVKVRGVELSESIRFKVYIPKGTEAMIADPKHGVWTK